MIESKFNIWRIGKSHGTVFSGEFEFVDGPETKPVHVCEVKEIETLALMANKYRNKFKMCLTLLFIVASCSLYQTYMIIKLIQGS